MSTTLENCELRDIEVALIDMSPLNPRRFTGKQLTEESLRPLAESLRAKGQQARIIVRRHPTEEGRYELADGARRFLAAPLAGLVTLAAEVRVLTDAQMLDLMLSTGTQGEPLSPLAEAHGYRERMEMEDISPEQLGEVLGVDAVHIQRRLLLFDLPQEVQEAVESGVLSARTEWLIASLPVKEDREAFAREVLHPVTQVEPLGYRMAEMLREAKYCRPLRGAAFNPKDAGLVPTAGSCLPCPHRSGNVPGELVGSAHNCLKPSCWEAKAKAARAKLVAEFKAKGIVPLTDEENARAFPQGEPGLSYKCDLVEYRKPVPRDLLKKEVDPAPKWTDICLGPRAVVQVRVGWDQHGLPVELVRVAEAVLAADENERAIFNEETLRRYNAENGLEKLKQERGRKLGEGAPPADGDDDGDADEPSAEEKERAEMKALLLDVHAFHERESIKLPAKLARRMAEFVALAEVQP
jgi:ParB/RepB/Spo0J family partition protein